MQQVYWASGPDWATRCDWTLPALATRWDPTLAALASGLDWALGPDWAASAFYLHYSVVVSNSHDQFIIGRRLNDKCVDRVRCCQFYLSARLIYTSNNCKNFRIALSGSKILGKT